MALQQKLIISAISRIVKEQDLSQVRKLCLADPRFKFLLEQDIVWKHFAEEFNVLRFDNEYKLTIMEKCRISNRRKKGIHKKSTVKYFNKSQMPCLQYYKEKIWFSSGNTIYSMDTHDQTNIIFENPTSDLTKFVVKNQRIISGCYGRGIHMLDLNNGGAHTEIDIKKNPYFEDTVAVDSHKNIIVSGSSDKTLKILKLEADANNSPFTNVSLGDKVRSVKLSKGGRIIACGTAFWNGLAPVFIMDTETCKRIKTCGNALNRGAGVLDLKFEDEHTLLTCGHDTYVRLWDFRTRGSQCVNSWKQQTDSAYYCLRSDGHRNIFAGTRDCSVDFFDKRQTVSPVNTFNVDEQNSSPVYSMDFNETSLFVALEKEVKILNFRY